MKRKVRSGVVPSPINMEEYLKEDEDLAQMLLEFDSDDDVDLASSQQEIEDIQKNLEAKEKRKKITQKYEKQQETFESILDVEDGRAKVIHEAMQNFSTSLQITLPASHEILGEPTLYFTKPCLNDFNLEFEPSELTDRRVSKLTSLVNQLVDGSDPKLEQKIMKSMQKKSVYESNPECLSPQLIQSLLTIGNA